MQILVDFENGGTYINRYLLDNPAYPFSMIWFADMVACLWNPRYCEIAYGFEEN